MFSILKVRRNLIFYIGRYVKVSFLFVFFIGLISSDLVYIDLADSYCVVWGSKKVLCVRVFWGEDIIFLLAQNFLNCFFGVTRFCSDILAFVTACLFQFKFNRYTAHLE